MMNNRVKYGRTGDEARHASLVLLQALRAEVAKSLSAARALRCNEMLTGILVPRAQGIRSSYIRTT